ncbi:Lsr2 family protein [Nonomuraea sp. K274]|uniref:Lsr2 family protein n=1 Tax=Nonomuraea cypriaca TaxID=1187855 RepID=A0A931F508_9ACTN|nr:histone-like nucleoid-structuring protein Lsr2 [Nonomuraea cypriaca]MBF8191558.1 Lsr2 family protein [Nonomuraea cypriaca]
MGELVIVRNPDPDSRLPYLVRLPLGAAGLILRAGGTWPREKAIYCHPSGPEEWPQDPEEVERVPVRSCVRRGAAIDLVLDRARENRSQIVFTKARGKDAIFWQTARVRKQARPNVSTPTARAAGVDTLPIVIDSGERYAYRFTRQRVQTVKRRLTCGDYAVEFEGRIHAAVERKSLPDLVASLLNTRLKYQLIELAALPHAAVVVEDRYSQVFKLDHVRPAVVADRIAELQVAFPAVPIVFCETRQLAEEWTYRFLAAAYTLAWHGDRPPEDAGPAPEPTTAEIRSWARAHGLEVTDRGRLSREIENAYRRAHEPRQESQQEPRQGPRDEPQEPAPEVSPRADG